jgi:thiamine biosynthesis lipoprotein
MTMSDSSVQRLRPVMGSFLAIEARAPSRQRALAGLEAAYAVVGMLEKRLHPHRPGSELAPISAAPLDVPQRVQQDIWELLALAKRIHELSDGVFDPCLPQRPGTLAEIELRTDGAVICHAPVALDLGGIAKGYAVDQAVAALRAQGCTAGLVNAGGDLRVFGAVQEVLVRGADGECRALELADMALAVSDWDAQRQPPEHQGYYLRGSGTAAGVRHAAVLAADTATADALTKCVLLSPPALAQAVLSALGGRHALS